MREQSRWILLLYTLYTLQRAVESKKMASVDDGEMGVGSMS